MPNYGGIRTSSGASSGQDLSQAGNGVVMKHGNRLTTGEFEGIPPIRIRHGNGQSGNPIIEFDEFLGRRLHMDLAVAGNIAIACRAALFIPRRIVMTMARGVPTTIKARFFTAHGGEGDLLWDVPATEWAKLTDDLAVVEFVLPVARRSFDYLSLNVEIANDVPFRASCWMFGDTLIASDLRGRAF